MYKYMYFPVTSFGALILTCARERAPFSVPLVTSLPLARMKCFPNYRNDYRLPSINFLGSLSVFVSFVCSRSTASPSPQLHCSRANDDPASLLFALFVNVRICFSFTSIGVDRHWATPCQRLLF